MSEILFYIVIFLANIIQGITGFAGTILAMPFSIHLVGYSVAKPVLNVLGIIAGIYVVVGGYKNVNIRELKHVTCYMGIGIIVGILVKHFFTGHERLMYAALGIFVIGIGARGLIAFGKYAWENGFGIMDKSPRKSKGSTEEREHYIEKGMTASARALLLFSGVVHGIFVSGGPLIITYLSNHTKSKEEFRRTVSAIWIILNSMILVSDIMAGYYTMNTMEMMTSACSATSLELLHATAPTASNCFTFASTKSKTYTLSSCFFTIFSHMDSPMMPSPINPIFIT
jgi:uncharacterized protein